MDSMDIASLLNYITNRLNNTKALTYQPYWLRITCSTVNNSTGNWTVWLETLGGTKIIFNNTILGVALKGMKAWVDENVG